MSAEPISMQELHSPEHSPLVALRDEARALQADAKRFAENVESWLVLHMQATEERHQYAVDEDPV